MTAAAVLTVADRLATLEVSDRQDRTLGHPAPEPVAERLAGSRITFDADFWGGAEDAEDWLVEPILARGRGHLLYAPAKAGKSLLALYVAACAATGRAVLDRPAGAPIRVLYCDLEMTRADVRERLTEMGFTADDDFLNLAYYSLPSLAALDTPQGGAELVELAAGHLADLVVIDTISRAVSGEENSNDTAQAFARHTGTPLKAAGRALWRIDHAGKDTERGARGGSAKVDDVDVVHLLTPRDSGRFTLKATHSRMGWIPAVVELERRLEPLAYTTAASSWPAGTKAAADALDRLGIPLDATRRTAVAALRSAGEGARNETVAAALRYRRSEHVQAAGDLS